MRLRVVAMTTATSVVAKAISVCTSFITIPLVLGQLGSEKFGIWMVIASLPAFLVFMDFGIGNGILNAVATANGKGDRMAIRRSFANGIAMLTIAAAVFLLLFVMLWPWVNWESALGLGNKTLALGDEVKDSVLALGIIFLVSIPATLAQRAFLGMQKGFIGGLWQIAANLLSFAAVILTLKLGGSVPGLVIAMFGVPAIVSIISALHLLRREPDIFPRMADLDTLAMRKIARDGSYFFLLQLAGALAFASDQLIISHQLDLDQVAVYSIYQKLFSPVPLMLSFVLTPLWAAYADAHARNEVQWIRRILGKSVLIALLGACCLAIPTAIFSAWLIKIWLGKSILPNTSLAVCLAIWMVVDSVGRCIAIFLNGVGLLHEQLIIVFAFVPLCLGLKLFFATWLGLYGIPLAASIAYLVTHVPGYTLLLRRWFLKQRSIVA